MPEILVFSSLIAPIVVAIVQVVKKTVNLPKNYVPLVALVLGVIIGFISVDLTDLSLTVRLYGGGLAGLSATGLFELTNTRKGHTLDNEKK